MLELCQTQIIDSGECIHYFYRKNVEPKEESPGISLSTPEKSLHPINLELTTYKSSVKSLPHGDRYFRTWFYSSITFVLNMRCKNVYHRVSLIQRAERISLVKTDEPIASFDKNSSNLQLRGVVSIAIWLQGQRAITNFIPLDNRWTALIRVYLGTVENSYN